MKKIKNIIPNLKEKISEYIDFDYVKENKKTFTISMIALLLVTTTIVTTIAITPKTTPQTETVEETPTQIVTLMPDIHHSDSPPIIYDVEQELLEENELFLQEASKIEEEGKAKREKEKQEAYQEYLKENGIYLAPPASPSKGFVQYKVPLSYEWQVYTYNLCKEYGVSYEVMLGLMNAESSFDFNAASKVAHGICQIHYCHEKYAKSIGIENYKEPKGNILLGVKFLSNHLKENDGDYHKALICYNYGSGGAQKHCFSKGIYQTDYSRKVMKFANNLKRA